MAINGTGGDDEFYGTRFDDEINGLGKATTIFQRQSAGSDRAGRQFGLPTASTIPSPFTRPPPIVGWAILR